MKDQTSKPPAPSSDDKIVPPDQGLWDQPALVDQEWRDAIVDETEIGMWEQPDSANQEWRDAAVDETETGMWDQSALVDQEWRDAAVDENETGMWDQSALVDQKWQDANLDENETGIWDQTPTSEAEWTDAPQEDEEEEKRQDGMVLIPKIAENLYYPLIPLIGYGFLGLSLFDHINIIYPVKISEPIWIVDTLGQISERIPILWIGFLLVFFRREGYVRRWEVGVLKFLSWLVLILGIVYLVMTPMLIGNTVRVYRLIDTQIDARASDQSAKIKRAKEQVIQTREEDISKYLQSRSQLNSPQVLTPKEFKENLLQQASKNLSEIEANTQSLKSSQLGELVKRTIKWSLGNLLSVFVCVWIWYLTRWTRLKNLELGSNKA